MKMCIAVFACALALTGCSGAEVKEDLGKMETDLHLAVTDGQEALEDVQSGVATVEQLDQALAPLLPASGAVGKAQTDLANALAAYHGTQTQATLAGVKTALAALESMSAVKVAPEGMPTMRKKRLAMRPPAAPPKAPPPAPGGK